MFVDRYRIIYFNILLLFLFLFNQFFLFFLVLYVKLPYLLNLDNEHEYQFDYSFVDFEDSEKYREFDIDDEFYYTLVYTELYLLSNCRFFFDIFGGDVVLDHVDFIDFSIYKQQEERNKKYIYKDTYIYENFSKLDYNMKYRLKKTFIDSFNAHNYIKEYDDDKEKKDKLNKMYNIIKNTEIKESIKYKQRYIYLKKYK